MGETSTWPEFWRKAQLPLKAELKWSQLTWRLVSMSEHIRNTLGLGDDLLHNIIIAIADRYTGLRICKLIPISEILCFSFPLFQNIFPQISICPFFHRSSLSITASNTNISLVVNTTSYFDNKSIFIKKPYFLFYITHLSIQVYSGTELLSSTLTTVIENANLTIFWHMKITKDSRWFRFWKAMRCAQEGKSKHTCE